MDHNDNLAFLRKNPQVSVLIIGGGINGIGTFRDLALQGVDVLLVDRGDFCSGASSASSHMAHGGIRYLENGEFRLVREAVSERNRMIHNAPHLVQPLPTVIPIFKIFSGLLNAPLKFLRLLDKPSERGALVIKIGLVFYDAFTGRQRAVPSHVFMDRVESRRRYPSLDPEVRFTARYFDGQILSPERLAMELVLDAEAEGPHARALNYVSFTGTRNNQVQLKDEITGESFAVSPHLIINAAGPWIDGVNTGMGIHQHYIGGTKGSHLVLHNPELRQAIGENEFFFENKDGRIVLILPFFDRVIIGTSDIAVEDPDGVRCSEEEIDYFIDLVKRIFPTIKVSRNQIVFKYSGVRPLEYSGARTTGQISRDHTIREDHLGDIPVFSLVGGKWTSYRAFSEQVTDKTLEFLHLQRAGDTKNLSIGGGRDYPTGEPAREQFIQSVAREGSLDFARARSLFERYGTRALEVAKFLQQDSDAPLKSNPDWTRREVAFLVEHENIIHPDDLLLRRSSLAWRGLATRALIEEISDIIAHLLQWNTGKQKAEAERTIRILKEFHGVEL